MTINPLTMRLKAAKRELLALKTAHTRGLGNVRIYVRTENIDPTGHTSGVWQLKFTIDFDPRFTAYPFVNVAPAMTNSGGYTMELYEQQYSNNGYSMVVTAYWWRRTSSGNTYSIQFNSTSPIIGLSYTWKEEE